MSRLAAGVVAVAALLVPAPAALAATYTVDLETDTGGVCAADPDGGTCTLRQAINGSNADDGPDTIRFASSVRTIELAGSGLTVLPADGSGSDGLTITDSQGDVTVTSTDASADPLLTFTTEADGSRVERVAFTREDGTGIEVQNGAQQIVITRSPIFGSGIQPIDLLTGANANIASPSVRVGPRQPDGSLPVTGSAGGGTVEIFKGNPSGSARTTFLGTASSNGSYRFDPSPQLQVGDRVAATLTGSSGTSEFSIAASVPSDIVSPVIAGSNATSQTQIRIQPSEPIQPASIALTDFTLDMAGQRRQIVGGQVLGGGQQILLNSATSWRAGEAGFLTLNGAGAMNDHAGNANTVSSVVRVFAGPGDTIPPVLTSFRMTPRRMCLTKNRRCRRPGMTVTFIASEVGRGTIEAIRGRGSRSKSFDVKPGRNRVRFDGRFRGRKLRAGRYRMHLQMADVVGNEAVDTPLRTFYVKRTTR